MIKSKKNIQKLYIELKASGKQVDKYFKQLNQYYPVPKTIIVLKAILEGVDKINSSTKESSVKLENVVNQYIEFDHDFRGLNFAIISNSVVELMSAKHLVDEEEKETLVKKIGNQITRAKELIEYSDSGENIKDYLTVIK
jgi:hypothetical protein